MTLSLVSLNIAKFLLIEQYVLTLEEDLRSTVDNISVTVASREKGIILSCLKK